MKANKTWFFENVCISLSMFVCSKFFLNIILLLSDQLIILIIVMTCILLHSHLISHILVIYIVLFKQTFKFNQILQNLVKCSMIISLQHTHIHSFTYTYLIEIINKSFFNQTFVQHLCEFCSTSLDESRWECFWFGLFFKFLI